MVARRAAGWLAAPSRFAGVGRTAARRWLVALASLLILASLTLAPEPVAPEFLHDAIVAAMRHGAGFYDSLADLLRGEGDARAARLLPPALASVAAALPDAAMIALVATALTILLWVGGLRLGALFARSAGVVMVVSLLAAGCVAAASLWLAAPHAGAAATLSALAIVARRDDRWGTAAAVACAAAIIDPAALLTIAALGLFALFDGARREARGWLLAFLAAGIVLAFHLYAVSAIPLSTGEPIAVAGAVPRLLAAAFPTIPALLAAPLVLLSTFGWATLRDPVGLRVLAVMVAGAALDGAFGLRSATLATALVAPGIALVPGVLADLVRNALDRRRITVTRVVR